MSKLRIVMLAIGLFFSGVGEGHSPDWKWYYGDRVLFLYPSSMYGIVEKEKKSINEISTNFETIEMNKRQRCCRLHHFMSRQFGRLRC